MFHRKGLKKVEQAFHRIRLEIETNQVFNDYQLKITSLSIVLSICESQVNCGSPITSNDDWSHKGGHKQIFRPTQGGGSQMGRASREYILEKSKTCSNR